MSARAAFRATTTFTLLATALIAPAVDAVNQGARLIVNEVEVMEFRTASGSVTAEGRAVQAANTVLGWKAGVAIASRGQGESWRVTMGDRTVVTVTKAEARAQQSDAKEFADRVAARLRTALALPPLLADPRDLILAPGRPGGVRFVGERARKAILTVEPTGMATIERRTGRLVVSPVREGAFALVATSGDRRIQIPVRVLPLAMSFPQRVEATVYGNPATADTVRQAVGAAVQASARAPVGATLRFTPPNLSALAPGATTQVALVVNAQGPGLFPTQGSVQVTVRNQGAVRLDEHELWYANNPENIYSPEDLYWGELRPGVPVRLLYHHRNRTPQPIVIRYVLFNPGPDPAQVQAIFGDGDPDQNPTLVGWVAGDRFLRQWALRSMVGLTLPPGTGVPLTVRRLGAGDTMSGLATMRLKSGQARIVGLAEWAEGTPLAWRTGFSDPAPSALLRPLPLQALKFDPLGRPKNVYVDPVKREALDYSVGGPFLHLRLGQVGIAAADGGAGLDGNFGVTYVFEGTLRNPTDVPRPVEILFEASAGYTGAVLTLNGRYIAVPLLQPKGQHRLLKVTLAAGGTQRIRIETVPLSGGSYPATIIVRPAGIGD